MADPVVQIQNLGVVFHSGKIRTEALRDVTLSIPRGALFALLGPNGAGKTTLMRGISGLIRPARGTVSRPHLGRIGVLIENPGIYRQLTVNEYLFFFGSFYGISDLDARIRFLCEAFGLDMDGKPAAKLSLGNRQKLQLVRSLLHRPELLLWDEPTDHLDPEAQRDVLGYLQRYLNETGATAVVATHRLEQTEDAATHFGFLRRGRLMKAGGRDEVLGSGGAATETSARISFASPVNAGALRSLTAEFQLALRKPDARAMVSDVEIIGPGLEAKLPTLIRRLCALDYPVSSAIPLRKSLADVYHGLAEP